MLSDESSFSRFARELTPRRERRLRALAATRKGDPASAHARAAKRPRGCGQEIGLAMFIYIPWHVFSSAPDTCGAHQPGGMGAWIVVLFGGARERTTVV